MKQDFSLLKLDPPESANVFSERVNGENETGINEKQEKVTDETALKKSDEMFTIKIKRKEEMKTLIETLMMTNKANVTIQDIKVFYDNYLLEDEEIKDTEILEVG